MVRAGPRHGRSDQDEIATADRTPAGILFADNGVDGTAPDAFRLQFRGLRSYIERPFQGRERQNRRESTFHPAVGMWKPADTALVAGHRVVTAFVRV